MKKSVFYSIIYHGVVYREDEIISTGSQKQTGYTILEVLKKHRKNIGSANCKSSTLVQQETGQVHVCKAICKDLQELVDYGYPVRFSKD